MSIKDWVEKIKLSVRNFKEKLGGGEEAAKYYTVAVIMLVGFASFGLGRLSIMSENRKPIIIENQWGNLEEAPSAAADGAEFQSASVAKSVPAVKNAGGKLVASKSGDKYHYPWCSGAQRISEANKLWFNSVEDARKAGYTPASNCKGLK